MTSPANGDSLSPSEHELLAIFLDGKASNDQRNEVLRRAAGDARWRELLAESAHTIAQLDAEAGGSAADLNVELPLSRGRGMPHLLLPLAAVAVLGLGLALWLPRWRHDPLSPSELAASLPDVTAAGSLDPRWYDAPAFPRLRGAATARVATTPADAFLLGARATDVEVARVLRDRDAVSFVARQIADVCGRVDALVSCEAAFSILAERPEALWEEPATPSNLLEVEPVTANRLGRWAESARIAAMAGDREFFESLAWSEGLEVLARPTADERQREIAARLKELARGDSAELEREIAELIRAVTHRALPL